MKKIVKYRVNGANEDIMATCNECRWKIERNECPWDYMYDEEEVDYAEDCIDFRNTNFKESEFHQVMN